MRTTLVLLLSIMLLTGCVAALQHGPDYGLPMKSGVININQYVTPYSENTEGGGCAGFGGYYPGFFYWIRTPGVQEIPIQFHYPNALLSIRYWYPTTYASLPDEVSAYIEYGYNGAHRFDVKYTVTKIMPMIAWTYGHEVMADLTMDFYNVSPALINDAANSGAYAKYDVMYTYYDDIAHGGSSYPYEGFCGGGGVNLSNHWFGLGAPYGINDIRRNDTANRAIIESTGRRVLFNRWTVYNTYGSWNKTIFITRSNAGMEYISQMLGFDNTNIYSPSLSGSLTTSNEQFTYPYTTGRWILYSPTFNENFTMFDDRIADLVAIFKWNQIAPLTIEFNDLTEGTVIQRTWSFGDGTTNSTTAGNAAIDHVYTTIGEYVVSLTVTEGSLTGSYSEVVPVTNYVGALQCAFGASPATVGINRTVSFTDWSYGYPLAWAWDFGDTYQSSDQSPQHQYLTRGQFTTTLTVSSTSGQSSCSAPITVIGPSRGILDDTTSMMGALLSDIVSLFDHCAMEMNCMDIPTIITGLGVVGTVAGLVIGYVASPRGKAAIKAIQDGAALVADYMKGKPAGVYTDADYIEIGKMTVAMFDDLAASGGVVFAKRPSVLPPQVRQTMKLRR